jgi:hypothetical protein
VGREEEGEKKVGRIKQGWKDKTRNFGCKAACLLLKPPLLKPLVFQQKNNR